MRKNWRERDLEKYLKERIKELGGATRKVKWPGINGAPDRFILYRGGHWVELKITGEKPSARQQQEHKIMSKHCIPVYVIDSYESADDFINFLGKL